LAAVAALAGCGSPEPERLPDRRSVVAPQFFDMKPHDWSGRTPWHYQVHGIDVSKWQGTIDWARVRNAGVSFAFIKATEGGDHTDERFAENWNGAARAGIPRGAYHFYFFCRTGAEQARWFIANVPKDPSALPPVLDMEWNHQSRTCRLRPSPETIRAEMETFLQIVTRHYGKRPIIYVTPDFYAENELGRITGYHFWLRSVAGHPGEVYPGQRWTFWQYSGTGVMPGIEGRTDLNVFVGGHAQWRAWVSATSS
jgi:lysozyme